MPMEDRTWYREEWKDRERKEKATTPPSPIQDKRMAGPCPWCKCRVTVPTHAAGKTARCPSCKNHFIVPTDAEKTGKPAQQTSVPPDQTASVQEAEMQTDDDTNSTVPSSASVSAVHTFIRNHPIWLWAKSEILASVEGFRKHWLGVLIVILALWLVVFRPLSDRANLEAENAKLRQENSELVLSSKLSLQRIAELEKRPSSTELEEDKARLQQQVGNLQAKVQANQIRLAELEGQPDDWYVRWNLNCRRIWIVLTTFTLLDYVGIGVAVVLCLAFLAKLR